MSSTFGFDEAADDVEVLVNRADGINKVYEDSADKIRNRSKSIANSKGLQVTGAGVEGIQSEVDSNGFKIGWETRPNLHLYFHEIGTYKDPARPHVRQSVDELEEEVYDDIQNELTE